MSDIRPRTLFEGRARSSESSVKLCACSALNSAVSEASGEVVPISQLQVDRTSFCNKKLKARSLIYHSPSCFQIIHVDSEIRRGMNQILASHV